MDKWDISDIPKERKLEIDAILKETEKDIEQNKLETISFEEFAERIKKMFAKDNKENNRKENDT